jgi:hypothetical protein
MLVARLGDDAHSSFDEERENLVVPADAPISSSGSSTPVLSPESHRPGLGNSLLPCRELTANTHLLTKC